MSAKDLSLWLVLAWLWGSSFLAIGIAVEDVSPATLVTTRLIIGAFLLVIVLYLRGGSLNLGTKGWALAIAIGATGNVVPFYLISFAEQHVESGLAALIMGIAPVVTLLAAPFAHADEALNKRQLIGGAVGFFGLIILIGPEALRGLGGDMVPQLAVLLAALCYAATALISRRFPYKDTAQISAASVVAGACIAGFASLLTGSLAFSEVSQSSIFAIIYLGLGPTALAAILYFHLIPRIGAGRLQQVNYVVPVLGMGLGAIILGERFGANAWIAVCLICIAVYLVTRATTPAPQASG